MLYQKIKILVNVWHVYIMRSLTFALCCSMVIFNSKIKFKKHLLKWQVQDDLLSLNQEKYD